MERLLEHMTWPEVRDALAAGIRTVLVPVGAIEQHGPQLPLNTDAVLGTQAALALAERIDALVAPVIRPGLSPHHMAMPGTLTLREETLRMLVTDILDSLSHHGFRRAVLIASHGGNVSALRELAASRRGDMRVYAVQEVPLNADLDAQTALLGLPEGANGGHADDRETSEMLLADPEHVKLARAVPGFTGRMDERNLAAFFGRGVRALSEIGVVGDPTGASAERGRWYLERTVERMEADYRRQVEECER